WQGFNSTSSFFVSASILSLARSALSHADGLAGRSTGSSSGTGRPSNQYFPGAMLENAKGPSFLINTSAYRQTSFEKAASAGAKYTRDREGNRAPSFSATTFPRSPAAPSATVTVTPVTLSPDFSSRPVREASITFEALAAGVRRAAAGAGMVIDLVYQSSPG